jgi:uncharacterized protein YihD (DUF1040 family)
MRDPKRIPHMLQLLGAAWMANPDLRLTQIISNAARLGGWNPAVDLYHCEDGRTTAGLTKICAGDVKI